MNYKNPIKQRNPVAKDLGSDKYRMRVVPKIKMYNRAKEENSFRKGLNERYS
jgi:hypothetical protein